MKKIYLRNSFVIIIMFAFSAAVNSSVPFTMPVEASSVYDDYIVLDDEMRVSNADGTCSQDVSTSYMSIFEEDPAFQAKWQNSYSDTGAWAISTYYPGDGQKWVGFNFVADETDNPIQFQSRPGESVAGTSITNWNNNTDGSFYIRAEMQQDGCRYIPSGGFSSGQLTYKAGSIYDMRIIFSTFNITYPVGYEGEQIPGLDADLDGDGLVAEDEMTQGTSDFTEDTDGDGLNDFIESQWNPDRNTVFCGIQCAYPDPTTKDIYVEIDWMKDSSNNVYKPSAMQLGLVEAMFDSKGINFHADAGQFGGGNELATYTQTLPYTITSGQVDFWDYRDGGDGITANFSPDRNLIWRYMIYGYNYTESTGSSGWAQTMGDDLFISGGLIENVSGLASLDRAIAGTIAHEVGHTLCLSDEQSFAEQPEECVFNGIDNNTYKPQNYASVMNYRYQLTDDDDLGVVDYSDGSNGTDDHDDWSGVMLGMGGFSGTHTELGKIIDNYYVSPKGNVYNVSPDGSIIVPKIPLDSVKESSKEAVLEEIQNQSRDGQDDTVLPTDLSQPTGGSTMERPVGKEPTENSPFDWTAVLSSGAAWRLSPLVLHGITSGDKQEV